VYLLAADDSSVLVAGSCAEMVLIAGNALDWVVVVELGNGAASRCRKCRLGAALNHSGQV
jgi:hypothetical protein